MALVTVIIVNYNCSSLLLSCLKCLEQQTFGPFDIIVIDNKSSDLSPDLVQLNFPNVEFIFLDSNIGFAAANNLALSRCKTELFALLNPDAFPEKNWLAALINASTMHPDAASFGSKLLQVEPRGRVDGLEDVYHASGLAWRAGHGRELIVEDTICREIFSPCAAAALYRTEAVSQVDGFDEDFFCYFEDVDLGFRLRLAGWSSRYVPEAKAFHVGGAASGGGYSEFSVYHGHRNLTWTFVKNMPGPLVWLLLPWHLALSVLILLHMISIGKGRVYLRSKWHAVNRLASFINKRKKIQRERKASVMDVVRLLNWKLVPSKSWDRFEDQI